MSEDQEAATPAPAWVKLLRNAAIAGIVVIVLVNIFAGLIPPLLVFGFVWLIGVIWLGRATKGPAILLLVGFLAYLGLSAPFIVPTLAVPASAGDFILNLASLLASVLVIVSAIMVLRRRSGDEPLPTTLGKFALGVLVAGIAVSVFATLTYDDAVAQEGDVQLVAKDIEFQQSSLEARAGEVSVFVENQDATLHTFTIEELDVDLSIPAGKSARVTFDADPGTYTFFCRPHESDMKGLLEID